MALFSSGEISRRFFLDVHVSLGLERNQMDVSVRDFHSKHADPYPLARHGGLDGDRTLRAKAQSPS